MVKHLVLSLKKTFEIRIIDPFLFQNRCQPGQIVDLGDFQGIVIGHVFPVERVLIWGHGKEEFFSPGREIFLHHGKGVGHVEKPPVRKLVDSQIIVEGILIIEPAVGSLNHAGSRDT